MNWEECAALNEASGALSRFDWPVGEGKSGFDCNEAFTFSDVTGAVGWLWTWPGDYLLSLPWLQSFFGLGSETVIGNGWSYAVPAILCTVALFSVREKEGRGS